MTSDLIKIIGDLSNEVPKAATKAEYKKNTELEKLLDKAQQELAPYASEGFLEREAAKNPAKDPKDGMKGLKEEAEKAATDVKFENYDPDTLANLAIQIKRTRNAIRKAA